MVALHVMILITHSAQLMVLHAAHPVHLLVHPLVVLVLHLILRRMKSLGRVKARVNHLVVVVLKEKMSRHLLLVQLVLVLLVLHHCVLMLVLGLQ